MFRRPEQIIIREESFGGMAFNTRSGTTIELDHEGQYLLKTLEHPNEINDLSLIMTKVFQREVSKTELSSFIGNLTELGFLEEVEKNYGQKKNFVTKVNKKEARTTSINYLSAPESVHLTVTNRCNLNCPLCYETKNNKSELSKEAIFSIIDELASMKVFQLAVGGGEPFLRKDIFDIINYCRAKDIVPNITTNGTRINQTIIKRLKTNVGGISVSLNGHSSITNIGRDAESFNDAVLGLKYLLKADIPTGVNVLVSNKNLQYLEDTFKFLIRLNVKWVNVLRLKPGLNIRHLDQYLLSEDDLKRLKKVLDRWNGLLKINVDTALTCLMHTVPKQRLREKAVYGCVAGIRFCTIDCNGDVYPCSFFKDSKFKAGNVLRDDFKQLWFNSMIFQRFREMKKRLKGKCGTCRINYYCGGCRSIVLVEKNDFYGEDTACSKDSGG